MDKSSKELAFLRELLIEKEWTERFTDYFDQQYKLEKGAEKVLYMNAGAGGHALALTEKFDENAEIYAICENEDLRNIAQAKADAIRAEVRFGINFSGDRYDLVIGDGSFVKAYETEDFVSEIVEASKKKIAFFLPTKGSYGETFSFLWEALIETDLADKGENVERLIAELPVVDEVEKMLENLGVKRIKHSTETEKFDFKDGAEFINSPVAANYLLPEWLDFLEEDEQEKIKMKLAELIDADDGELTFRFSVKNTLFSGEV